MRQLARNQGGTSTIEFALVLPILVLLTVGLVDIARALNAEVVVGGASQDGAHYTILHPTASLSEITDAARARAAPLNASAISVTAEYYDNVTATFIPWPSASPVGIPASTPARGVLVRVSVSYPWSAVSALADGFFSGIGSRTLTSTSVMETRR